MDFEEILAYSIFSVILLAILSALGIACLAPKNVDYYYLSLGRDSHMATCVYAHWTWHTDERSFCTNSKDEALDFVTKANATLKKGN